MYNIKIYSEAKNVIYERQSNKEDSFSAKMGDIIKATVTKMENQRATLYVNEKFSFEADQSKINAKLGDEVLFEAVKSDGNTFYLRQLNNTTQVLNRKQMSTEEMMELFKQQGMYKDDVDDAFIESQKKAAEAETRIRRKVKGIAGNATQNAINELIASGLSLEKISMDMLSNVMREAENKTRIEKPEGIKPEQYKSNIKRKNGTEDFRELLKDNDITDNKQNIQKLESVKEKWDEVKDFGDDAIVTVLRTGKKLTLENMYKAKYSTLKQSNNTEPSADIDSLTIEIEKFLQREGFTTNDENIQLSKLLIANDIPLNAENFNKALFLCGIGDYNTDKILQLACDNIKNNKRVSDIEFFVSEQNEVQAKILDEYNETIKVLPEITADNVEHVMRSGRELTLRNIIGMNYPPIFTANVTEEALSAKRRLVEIQHKLTSEAAVRLASKNININTMPIQEALETLRQLERQRYESDFKITGAPATEENINEITDLYDMVKGFRPTAGNVFGDIISKRVSFTVNGVHESTRLAENYENSITRVNPSYGDSFSKVSGQFADLLKNLGIEATEENIKASVILSKNNLEVNEENILRILNIDSKINEVYDKLHPYIAIDMIRKNMNPANMHIDEVLDYIDTYNGAYGVGVKDKIANYIMEMDNSNILSDMAREAMVGVYRMLSMIQKDGSVALGVSIKKESEITLGSLFNDAKYYQRTKASKTDVDMRIDDKSDIKVRSTADGSILNAVSSLLDENIMGQTPSNIKLAEDVISSSGDNNNRQLLKLERFNRLINEITDKAATAALNSIIENNPDFMELTLSELSKLLDENQAEASGFINERYTQMINDMQNIPAQVIRWMEENNIPATLNNMFAAANLLKKPDFIADKLNETQITDVMEFDTELEEFDLYERLSEISERLPQLLENQTTGEMIERVNALQNALRLQNNIHQRQGNNYFQIPVKLHDKISNVNMYVLNEHLNESNEATIYMSLNTTNLGNVSMYINISGEEARLKVCVPDQTSLKRLKNSVSELESLAEEAGFKVSKLEFDVKDGKNIFENEVMPTGSNGKPIFSEFEFAV